MQTQFRDPDADDEVSLFDLWQILRKDWWVIAGTTLAVGAGAALATYAITPVFEARAVIMEVNPAEQGGAGAQALLGQFGGLAELAGVNLDTLARGSSGGRTLIQSRTFIEEFISRNDLLPLIFPDDWDAQIGTWKADSARVRTLWEGADEFRDRVFDLSRDPETDLLTLSIQWTDPETAAAWANQLVALANELARQKDIADSGRSVEYLNKQIDETNVVELQRVLYNLLEAELRTLILANAREDYAFRVVDRAVAPVYRAKPRRTLITAFGIVAGGFLGILIVLFRRVPKLLHEQEAAKMHAKAAT